VTRLHAEGTKKKSRDEEKDRYFLQNIQNSSGMQTSEHPVTFRITQLQEFISVEKKTTQYCAGDKIEKNEMGWACGASG